jgi:hypothetical protein
MDKVDWQINPDHHLKPICFVQKPDISEDLLELQNEIFFILNG